MGQFGITNVRLFASLWKQFKAAGAFGREDTEPKVAAACSNVTLRPKLGKNKTDLLSVTEI